MGREKTDKTVNCFAETSEKFFSFESEKNISPTRSVIYQSMKLKIILSGKGKIKISDREYEIKKDSAILIYPWQIIELTKVIEPISSYTLTFKIEPLNEIAKLFLKKEQKNSKIFENLKIFPVVNLNNESKKDFFRIIKILKKEFRENYILNAMPNENFSYFYITTLIGEIMVILHRHTEKYLKENTVKKEIHPAQILFYLYCHTNKKITLKDLSEIFYISPSTISRYIHETTGLSFFDLINEMRVAKTINYLLYTDLTIGELAPILGYADSAHLSKVFTARISMNAAQYRKTYAKIEEICGIKRSKLNYTIISYIIKNSEKHLTVGLVSQKFGISLKRLHEIILFQTEMKFETFLNSLRIDKACYLLTTTKNSIIDISISVGYNSVKSFTRNFLKFKKISPTKFRASVSFIN